MPKILKSGLLLLIGAALGIGAMTAKQKIIGEKAERLARNNEMLSCPEGSAARWERWGGPVKQGWAHYCQMNHGPYHVWIDNQLYIEGQFHLGEKVGEWLFRNDDKVLKQQYEPSKKPASTPANGGSE